MQALHEGGNIMNAYAEAFYRYIQEHPLKYYDVEIASVLESIYGIAVPEEVLDEMEILEDLVGYVEDRM